MMIIPEILTILTALVYPEAGNHVLVLMLAEIMVKMMIVNRFDIQSSASKAAITMVSVLFDISVILESVVLDSDSMQNMKKNYLAVFVFFILVLALGNRNRQIKTDADMMFKIVGVITVLTCILAVTGPLVGIVEEGDGTLNIAGRGLFQVPELLKNEMILIGAYVMHIYPGNKKAVRILFEAWAVISFSMMITIREFGTVMMLINYTLALLFCMTISNMKESTAAEKFTKTPFFPAVLTGFYCAGITIFKNVTYRMFPRGELGYIFNETYLDGKSWIKNMLYELSSRLWSDQVQVINARESLKSTPLIQRNFNIKEIISSVDTTMLSDYVFVTLAQAFGKLIAVLIILSFAAVLIYAYTKSGSIGKSICVMMIIQTLMQPIGICFEMFTGIGINFISCGGSSLLLSMMMLAVLVADIETQRKGKAE